MKKRCLFLGKLALAALPVFAIISTGAGAEGGTSGTGKQKGGRVLDNAGLVEVVEAGVPLDVVLNMMKSSTCRFSAAGPDLIRLKAACDKAKVITGKGLSTLLNKVIQLAQADQERMKMVVDMAMNNFENAVNEAEYERVMRRLLREGHGTVPYLLEHLDEESEKKRYAVLDALRRFADKSADVRRSVVLMLNDRAAKVRAMAAKCTAALSTKETVAKLTALLKRLDQHLDGTIMALGYLGAPEAVEPLVKLLNKGVREETKVAAAFALGHIGVKAEPVISALRRAALTPGSAKVRDNASRALALLGDRRLVPIVIRAFQRYHKGRADIIRHLRRFKKPEAVEFLIAHVDDDDKAVRLAAADTLKALTGEDCGTNREKWQAMWFQIKTRPEWLETDKPR